MAKPKLAFKNITMDATKPTFEVRVEGVYVGIVKHFWINHLNMSGWEASGLDGHRAVHETRNQAAKALTWNGKGYPFPFR